MLFLILSFTLRVFQPRSAKKYDKNTFAEYEYGGGPFVCRVFLFMTISLFEIIILFIYLKYLLKKCKNSILKLKVVVLL